MNLKKIIILSSVCLSYLFGDATISSYNCGGLKDHYDYLRAVAMHKVSNERYNVEPTLMAEYARIQELYLKILFSKDPKEQALLLETWKERNYEALYKELTASPKEQGSVNAKWYEFVNQVITPYNIRPVEIYDEEVNEMLYNHLLDLTKGQDITLSKESSLNEWLDITRTIMAERIFKHELKYDIIALQEADYLKPTMFPEHFETYIPSQKSSVNGFAWNSKKFEFVRELAFLNKKAVIIELLDKESGDIVAIASAHLTGCNPFKDENGDSVTGNNELEEILQHLEGSEAAIKILAMDSNVTAKHPRMELLRDKGYSIDFNNYLEGTCTSPHQVIDTRIDWIAIKSSKTKVGIENIPVLGVHLNSPQSNMSDHTPIAAKVSY